MDDIIDLSLPHTSIPSPPLPPDDILDVCGSDGLEGFSPSTAHVLDFSERAQLEELMDQPCSYEELRACLRDIARVNRLTFANRPTLSWLGKVVAARPAAAGPLRVVDVGCGYGDTLRLIDHWAARRGIAVTLTGIDLNGDAIRAAIEATPRSKKIEWRVGDALSEGLNADTDVVICSLLTHHLNNGQIVRFLRWMEEIVQCGWFVNDLHRQPVPYHLFRLWARVTNWHPFVKNDGPISIRRSFIVEDWRRLCAAAELAEESVSIRECRPARLCVGRIK
jgi:SAM-dependent methyltransferase